MKYLQRVFLSQIICSIVQVIDRYQYKIWRRRSLRQAECRIMPPYVLYTLQITSETAIYIKFEKSKLSTLVSRMWNDLVAHDTR